jgi:RNA polymerase sigma factor (sigma-70 family)
MSSHGDNAELFAALTRARRSRSAVRVRAAVSAIVVANSGLVYQAARRWAGRGVDVEDLAQAAMLGLLRTIDLFEPERGFTFSTYAAHWLRHHLRREVQNHAATVRTPVHMQARRKAHGESERAVVVPLDVPIDVDDGPCTRLDALPDDGPLPDEQAADRAKAHAVRRLLARLPDGERSVIVARFWGEQTLSEVGPSYRGGVTRERIRQVEKVALDRMRQQVFGEGLSP